MKLSDISYYVTEKINSSNILLKEYVTTDSLLPNKAGRTIAVSLPPTPCNLTHYNKNDILIANIRPYLKKIWKADCSGGASTDVLVFRAKNGISPAFLHAVLLNDAFFTYVMKSTTGAQMPRGEKGHIMRYCINELDETTQEKVGELISSLDRKIALNRKENEILEKMAKQLYDYWFVQFDFPDENGRPYKSSGGAMEYNPVLKRDIPKGWEVKKIEDIYKKISSGKRPAAIDKSLKNGIPSLGAECIDKLGVFDYSKTPYVAEIFRNKLTSGIIDNRDLLIYKDGEYVGKTTLFQDGFPFKEAFVNEHVFLLHCKNEDLQEYMYFTLSSPTYFSIMQSLGKAKAAQPGLNQNDLKGIDILMPNNKLLISFRNSIRPIFSMIFSKSKDAETLRQIRDFLLPLLMNGQVTIKD